MRVDVCVSTDVNPTTRMRQVSGMFDAPIEKKSHRRWSGDVPIEDRSWSIGLIVGPSGAGKSTVARQMFGSEFHASWDHRSIVDNFDPTLSVDSISQALSAVGFNTIPAWLRPHGTLSNGEKFRCDLARMLVSPEPIVWVDEFTSVVDRQVAKIGSAAVARYVRKTARKFVAVGCHYDVIDWLQPDWVLEPADMTFAWRSVRRRPPIDIVIRRAPRSLWSLFAPYHYMSAELSASARCFAAYANNRPIAFVATLPLPVSRGSHRGEAIVRVSRIVVLPDWQGCGVAFPLLESIGAAYAAIGKRFRNYPAAPNFVAAHRRPAWREISGAKIRTGHSNGGGRPCAVYEYVGPSSDRKQADRILALG